MKNAIVLLILFTSATGLCDEVSKVQCDAITEKLSDMDFKLYIVESREFGNLFDKWKSDLDEKISQNPKLVNCTNSMGSTPLTSSLSLLDNYVPMLHVANYLIEKGADVNGKDESFDLSPLYYATDSYKNLFSPNGQDSYKATDLDSQAFHPISRSSLAKFITLLKNKGADQKAVSHNGVAIPDIQYGL